MTKASLSAGLTEFTAEQQRQFVAATLPGERQERGHYGTPPAIADFMAGMFSRIPAGKLRILDPGAGVGTLTAALCERILAQKSPRQVEVEAWENDPKLIPHLQHTLEHCRQSLLEFGHRLEFNIRVEDFVLVNSQKSLFHNGPASAFHLAILNPPYFKVRKSSPLAASMRHIVHGQPNIYAFFLAVTAELLLPGGELVAITPRSYFNGSYFARFRRWFFERMTARQIHLFESRTEAFQEDAVLQESVILLAEKAGEERDLLLTTSPGRDLDTVTRCTVPYAQTVGSRGGDRIVRVATSPLEQEIIEAIDSLPGRFIELGFEVSTGPVVTFRAIEYLRHERSHDTAPLLWMHNVKRFGTKFPDKTTKPTHIAVSESSQRLLLPAQRYVLLKRFTAKEEKRRLVAGILEAGDSYGDWVGLENHLNYIYRPRGELTRNEAVGLAAYFNSTLVDRYFRAISGNTQVNAREIRALPFPDESTLVSFGQQLERESNPDACDLDRLVGKALRLPPSLIARLCEAAS